MRRALLVLAAISFSQLAVAQTTTGRNDSGASTEPQSPADASVSRDVANQRGDKQAEQQGARPQVEPRDRALKEESAGTGVTATPLPPRDESVSKDVANQRGDKQGEVQGSLPQVEPRDRALRENPPAPGVGATATPLPGDKQSEEQKPGENTPK
jgi:hypothetical protein